MQRSAGRRSAFCTHLSFLFPYINIIHQKIKKNMKQYISLTFVVALLVSANAWAADFTGLLDRINADASQQKSMAATESWLGRTDNPYGDTDAFKARDEFYALALEAFGSAEKKAELNAFLVDSLKKDVRMATKVWLLDQLANSGTEAEIPAIAACLDSKDQPVVDAAAAALARIPGQKATDALNAKAALPAVKAALFERNRELPPWQPVESAMPFGISNGTAAQVDAWMAGYEKLDELQKAQTIAGLAARQDKKYLPVVIDALKSDSEYLKKAAWLALEKLGGKDQLDALLANLDTDPATTIRIAAFIEADGFDAALKAKLNAEKDPGKYIALVTILCNRSADVRAEVFAKTMQKECANRLGLLQEMAKVATVDDVPALVASTLQFAAGGEKDAAENIIAQVCLSDAAPIIKLMGKYSAEQIYPMIGRTGGDAALAEINKGLASKDDEAREAAVKALSVWPNAKVADRIWEVATDKSYSKGQNIAALRAFIRVISLPDDKIGIGISKDGKLEKLVKAFDTATRVDEKKLVLSRLAANRTVKSLQFAVKCAADPELAEAAYYAIADHAHDNTLRQQNMTEFGPAMDLVINNSKDKGLVERVNRYKTQK